MNNNSLLSAVCYLFSSHSEKYTSRHRPCSLSHSWSGRLVHNINKTLYSHPLVWVIAAIFDRICPLFCQPVKGIEHRDVFTIIAAQGANRRITEISKAWNIAFQDSFPKVLKNCKAAISKYRIEYALRDVRESASPYEKVKAIIKDQKARAKSFKNGGNVLKSLCTNHGSLLSAHAIQELEQWIKDQNLMIFKEALPLNIRSQTHGLDANEFRQWMKDHTHDLAWVTELKCRSLTEIPTEIQHLTQLQTLDLSENRISQIPTEIQYLSHLQKLNLSFNSIIQIPPEIQHLTQLQILDLYFNQITQIPTEIQHLTQLQTLYLSFNFITQIPPEIQHLLKNFRYS